MGGCLPGDNQVWQVASPLPASAHSQAVPKTEKREDLTCQRCVQPPVRASCLRTTKHGDLSEPILLGNRARERPLDKEQGRMGSIGISVLIVSPIGGESARRATAAGNNSAIGLLIPS